MQAQEIIEPQAVERDIVFMECPFCHHDIAAIWQPLAVVTDPLGRFNSQQQAIHQLPHQITSSMLRPGSNQQAHVTVTLQWLICQNLECREVVVQVARNDASRQETWYAVPKRTAPPFVNPLVTAPLCDDYREAWTILDDSPKMSAVLSRRLLADLLEKHANLKQPILAQRIDEFIKETKHPLGIRKNLHYLREMGNFGAHTQVEAIGTAITATTADPVIINVEREEAEWTLRIVADLFEYFIIAPQKTKRCETLSTKRWLLLAANR